MTKSELIQFVADKLGPQVSARDIEVVVNTMFDSMRQSLCRGDRIEIRGLGSFSVRQRRARQGRNPKTGESVAVPKKRVPFFTAGQELRQRINDAFLGGNNLKVDSDTSDS